MKPTALALTAAAIAALITLALTQPLPTAQARVDASDFEYRVIPASTLLAEADPSAAAIEGALNLKAADDWELVTTTSTNHFIFRRPVLN